VQGHTFLNRDNGPEGFVAFGNDKRVLHEAVHSGSRD
jgi:hypothetical protein